MERGDLGIEKYFSQLKTNELPKDMKPKFSVGDLVKITDNQDGLNEELAVVIQTLPSTGEVVIHHIRDNTPWIYYVDQLTLLSEVRK